MSFVDVVALISENLVARLASENASPLEGNGEIEIGVDKLAQQGIFPRVVVVPKGGPIGPKDVSNGAVTHGAPQLIRSIGTLWGTGEVHCWGSDYGPAEELAKRFIASLHSVAKGAYKVSATEYNDRATVGGAGREMIFTFSVGMPIIDAPLAYAPKGTKTTFTTEMAFPNGAKAPNP